MSSIFWWCLTTSFMEGNLTTDCLHPGQYLDAVIKCLRIKWSLVQKKKKKKRGVQTCKAVCCCFSSTTPPFCFVTHKWVADFSRDSLAILKQLKPIRLPYISCFQILSKTTVNSAVFQMCTFLHSLIVVSYLIARWGHPRFIDAVNHGMFICQNLFIVFLKILLKS